MRPGSLAALLLAVALAAACGDERQSAEAPAPQEPTREAVGHYCGMLVVEHAGPKGQIFLEGRDEPLWFTSVRDTIAFTLLPEEPKALAAVYVSDMAKATSWDHPGPGAWIAAGAAYFVIGSDARGGMGAPEAVPFSDKTAAERFRGKHGGTIYGLEAVPERYILGPAEGAGAAEESHGGAGHD